MFYVLRANTKFLSYFVFSNGMLFDFVLNFITSTMSKTIEHRLI